MSMRNQSQFVAWTPREGRWEFTRSDSVLEAMHKLSEAIRWKRVLSYPIDNPISAVAAHHPTPQAGEQEQP